MSKNVKRLLIVVAIVLVGVILVVSGTISINAVNLLNWFKDAGQWIWARLAPIIPLKEILCFLAGVAVTAIVVAIRNSKK